MTARPRPWPGEEFAGLIARVEEDDAARLAAWPGEVDHRQPIQTLYVAADRFGVSSAVDAGAEAARLFETHAPDGAALGEVIGIDPSATGIDGAPLAVEVRERVAVKLANEPVEDIRCDFEDAYQGHDGVREDGDAIAAGRALAEAWRAGMLPPFCGVRVKPFCDGLARRSIRTLDRVLDGVLEGGQGLPDGFVVTFPKVVATGHVGAFAESLALLEDAHGLQPGALRFEVQVETTQSLIDRHGRLALRAFLDAAAGRLRGAHFGVYDYTAALGLPPAEQRLDHPVCDAARHLMQIGLAGTGVWLSDGSTNVVPVRDDREEMRRVWQRHAADVRHSLRLGFRQGWDLHPAHLVSRYAAVYADVLGDLDEVCARLARWYGAAGPGAGDHGVLDEPATVRALLARLRRAVECGAADEAEASVRAGLEPGTLLRSPAES